MRTPVALPPSKREHSMCDKCTELDKKIDRYEELSGWGIDKTALEGIHFLIAKYKAERKALHPDR